MSSQEPARVVAIGVYARQIGARVVTYDVAKAPDERFAALANFLGIEFASSPPSPVT